jgi:hypothetical protein
MPWRTLLLPQTPLSHPALEDLLAPLRSLEAQVQSKALERLHVDGTVVPEQFAHNPMQFATEHFAFFQCFKCKQPYFGGLARCEDNRGDDSFNAEVRNAWC